MSKLIVDHGTYGCDTGCCGHWIAWTDGPVDEYGYPESVVGPEKFVFSHPWDNDHLQWAKDLVRDQFGPEHVADLDWENSRVVDD